MSPVWAADLPENSTKYTKVLISFALFASLAVSIFCQMRKPLVNSFPPGQGLKSGDNELVVNTIQFLTADG